jgi:hypothetical protein
LHGFVNIPHLLADYCMGTRQGFLMTKFILSSSMTKWASWQWLVLGKTQMHPRFLFVCLLPQATCWDVATQQSFLLSPMQLILFKESCQCNLDSINHVGIFFGLVGVEGFQPSASFFSQFSKMQDLRH